jgi:hypothetical protein
MKGPKKRWLVSSDADSEPGVPAAGGAETGAASGSEGWASAAATSVISRKELARVRQREAYQRAKQARAIDPRHIAMKEAVKQRRRELYQQVKEQRKTREAELGARQKQASALARAEAKRQLTDRVKSAIAAASGAGSNSSSPGPGLARDIDRALLDPDVKALLDRLTEESAGLAALAAEQGGEETH